MLSGKSTIKDTIEFNPEQLIPRSTVDNISYDSLLSEFQNSNVCIMGGGGSIGSELCLQLVKYSPNSIIICDNSEFNLHNIYTCLAPHCSSEGISLIPLLLDLTRYNLVISALNDLNVDIIINAAAYKHVPVLEMNPTAVLTTIYFLTLTHVT